MRLQDRSEDQTLHQSHAPNQAPEPSNKSSKLSKHESQAPQHYPSHDEEPHGLYRVGVNYGRFVYRLRWVILALWVIALGVSIPFASQVSSVLTGGGYSFRGSESVRADNIISSKLNQPKSSLLVVFQSGDTATTDPAYQQEVGDFISRAKGFSHVTGIYAGGVGADGKTTSVTITFDQDSNTVENRVSDFEKLLPSGADATPARAYLTGGTAVYHAFNVITGEDTKTAEEAALPIALVVLIIVFGTLIAASLPLILALVAVPIALAFIYIIALHTETSVFVLNVASIIGLGISIDYSLFMVRRFRDELADGRTVRDAVGWTVATAGEAILFSGLTVMIGFTGLLLIGIPFMTSFGIGGAVVVAVAVFAALTLLPALLAVLGSRVNALRVPLLWRLVGVGAHRQNGDEATNNGQRKERANFWHTLAMGVMRHPVIVIVVVGVALLSLGWPVLSINIGTPSTSSLPPNVPARQGLDILNAQFPSNNQNPIYVVVQTPDGGPLLNVQDLQKVDHLTQWLKAQDHVTAVTSLTELPAGPNGQTIPQRQLLASYATGVYLYNPQLAQFVKATTNDDTTVITLKTDATVDSAAGKALIDHLRANRGEAQGLTMQVGGFQAVSLDFNRYLYGNFPRAILYILIATYLLLLLMFRSALLPLKAIVMNALSVCAAYGALVIIFQWGALQGLLNFQSDGFIDSTIPILMFCIIFGLSMDYEVFLLSRIHEEWLRTKNNRYAVARGLEKTGGVITNAALLFVIVTG
ncbi:MAG: MMPL family transporter, partial [Ktedonobacterales bacterium]